ncbi:MAG: tRNA pseudouridine synthase A [Taibaiella sp.]|nr:tRNA pseudouridine synthase A [Taibaiella sp.]
MARYFLEVAYVGTAFHGSQLQGQLPTVQLALNNALTTLLRTPTPSFGASRTDEGVHALCNFYHFDTPLPLHDAFLYKLNAILPHSLAVKKLYKAGNDEANVRFDARSRRYRYRIYARKEPFLYHRAMYYPYPIDIAILHQTADIIKEYDHFESFSKRNTQSRTFICTIKQSYWQQVGTELHYVVEANRFLRGMVRGLVGTQLKLAKAGGDGPAALRQILDARDCTKADFSVPGYGLYLEDISYPADTYTEIIDKKTGNYNQ